MAYFSRQPTNQNQHDRAVRDIAKKRFDEIKYDVYVNPGGEKNVPINPSNPIYPDIVVLEKGYGTRTAIAIAEVETVDSITEEEATQWLQYAATKIPFYLYVPAGYANQTSVLLEAKGIKISGLRTYRYLPTGELAVTNIF